MKGIEQAVDPKTHKFYFDINGYKNSNFSAFNHDYKPVHGPINAPMAQDFPKNMKEIDPASFTDDAYDPYMAIASLRRQFRGNGRKLAGFIIYVNGVRGELSEDMPYTIKKHPPHRKLFVATVPYGLRWDELRKFDVAHCVTMHLHWYMAFMERRWNYFRSNQMDNEIIENNQDPDGSVWEGLKNFKKADGMADAQWPTIIGKRIAKLYPTPAIRRELFMPSGTVDFGDLEIGWDQMEACLKHTMEKGIKECGYIGYGDLAIVACDNKGAVTVGGPCKGLRPSNYAHWGNLSYHVFLQDSIEAVAYKDFAHVSDDPLECLQEVADMMQNLYDFSYERYLSRKRCTTSWMATAFSYYDEKVMGKGTTPRDERMANFRAHAKKELTKLGKADELDNLSGFEKVFIWA